MSILCVDPGFHTGYAYFHNENDFTPIFGTIELMKDKKVQSLERRMTHLFIHFDSIMESFSPDVLIVEGVKLYQSSKSQISGLQGDLFQLAYLVGGYCSKAEQRSVPFKIINAVEWKGQLTKEAVEARVKRLNSKLIFKDTHAMDAVAIGFNHYGHL